MNEMRKLMEAIDAFDKQYGGASPGIDNVDVLVGEDHVRISDGEHTVTMYKSEWERILAEYSHDAIEKAHSEGYSLGFEEGYAEGKDYYDRSDFD